MIPEHFRLKNTIKYPTSLIVGGLSRLGLEIADSLIEQGGYVVIVDTYSEENINKLNIFPKGTLVSFIDYTTLANLDEDLRRLDYIFYFNHESLDYMSKISTQDFLKFSNYLDTALAIANKFEAKFLLTTAIRAHQLSLTYDDLSVKFGVSSSERHTVYTEMEVQRYAESLVMEYIEKTKLDARIVRLGEIIGEGIDFATKTFFNELVLDVAKKEALKLSKDGLESEWMVHLMDAAYGIIKAQFSKDTAGKIFSIAYPNPFTHLSLAYKVQELEADAKEIQFIDQADNLPEIRLYKPAPNLAIIGWAPKVPIDKAITQSVAAAKIYLLENEDKPTSDKASDSGTVVNKLKGFLTLADKSETKKKKEDYGGPISRLIAERKMQEEQKLQSIEEANETVKAKKNKKKRTLKETATNKVWNFSLGFGNTFGAFKNRSPGELFKIFALIIIVVLFFIYIFSPIVSIGKDVVAMLPFYNGSLSSVENSAFDGNALHADILNSSLENLNSNFKSFAGLANLVHLGDQFQQIQATIGSYQLLTEGLNDIQYAVDPLYQYFANFANNTQVRTGADGYLTLTPSTQDYSKILIELQTRTPYLDSGIEKYKKGLDQAQKINYSALPGFLAEKLVNLNYRLQQNEDIIESLKSMKTIPEILGLNKPRTYLLLLEDNTRLKPVGGETSAFLLITLTNGAITDVVMQTPEQVSFDYKNVLSSTIDEINQRKFTYITKDTVSMQDFGNIYNFDDYSQGLTKLFKDNLNKDISGVLTLNYNSFADLLKLLDEKNLAVNVNNTKFDGKDFLSQLANSQTGNETIAEKHVVTAEIYAQLMNNLLTNLKNLSPKIIANLNKGIESKDIMLSTSGLAYDQLVKTANLDGSLEAPTEGYSIGYNVEDSRIVSLDKNLNFNIAEEARIDSKDTLSYKLTLQFPSVGASQELSVCIPPNVANDAIQVKDIESTRVTINSAANQKCIVAKILKEKNLEIDWQVKANLQQDASDYTLSLPSKEIRGADIILDKKIILEPDLKFQSVEPYTALQENSLIYNMPLNSDLGFSISYSKQ